MCSRCPEWRESEGMGHQSGFTAFAARPAIMEASWSIDASSRVANHGTRRIGARQTDSSEPARRPPTDPPAHHLSQTQIPAVRTSNRDIDELGLAKRALARRLRASGTHLATSSGTITESGLTNGASGHGPLWNRGLLPLVLRAAACVMSPCRLPVRRFQPPTHQLPSSMR
jgi:hypothetical protein